MLAVCQNCGYSFKAKRVTARYCSGRCRAADQRRMTALPPATADGARTLRMTGHSSDNPTRSAAPLRGNNPRLTGEPFTFDKDTIAGRKWRVDAGWLECEAAGGWRRVVEVADSTDLALAIAWLSGAFTDRAEWLAWCQEDADRRGAGPMADQRQDLELVAA
jgi:hypothetical protein